MKLTERCPEDDQNVIFRLGEMRWPVDGFSCCAVKQAKHLTNFYISLIYKAESEFNVLDLVPAKD